MKNLTEKVAVVTGSSKGIGAAIALKLAQKGAKVIVNYSGNRAAADETVSRITSTGGQAIAVKADVSRKEEVEHLFDKTIEHFGKVDIWVNNAGVMLNALIKDLSEEQLEKQLDINIKGVFTPCNRRPPNFLIMEVSSTFLQR